MQMLEIAVAARSERGQRETNEDALRNGQVGQTWHLLLADGAGGHARGAEAAERVVDRIERSLRAAAPGFTPGILDKALRTAHAELQGAQHGAQGVQRMHSTVVVLWIDLAHARALWSHVGDSRLYRLRYGEIVTVTVDDSVVQRMVEAELLTPDQARHHPRKNQLVSALGMVDAIEPKTLAHPVEIEDGDAFLLCCDGWWGALTDAQVIATLEDTDSPLEWLDAMQREIEAQALSRQDNFSAIAVWICDPSQTTQVMPEDDD
jgi:serine/threonine protein phosphatase PrpC